MQSIVLFHNSKWYMPIWVLLFVLALITLWLQRDKWKSGYNTFWGLITVSLLIIYCPILSRILIPRFLSSFAEYERLAWIFFEIPLISYVLIMLSKEFSSKKRMYLFMAAFLGIFLLFGSPDNRVFFQTPHNKYKIPQDSLELDHILEKGNSSEHIVVCMQLHSSKAYSYGAGLDGSVFYGLRMKETRYLMRYKAISPKEYETDDFSLSDGLPLDIDYYICPKEESIYRELERLGYVYIDTSENFAVFFNPNKVDPQEAS